MHMLVSLPYLITSIYGQGLYKINIASWTLCGRGFKKNSQKSLHIGKLYIE